MIRELSIIVIALLGLALSMFIRYKRTKDKPLVCFIGADCNKVIASQYAQTFGVPNDITGIVFYSFIIIAHIFLLLNVVPSFGTALAWSVLVTSSIAALFSLYLLSVQLLILKEWCEWCIMSSVFSITLFVVILLL